MESKGQAVKACHEDLCVKGLGHQLSKRSSFVVVSTSVELLWRKNYLQGKKKVEKWIIANFGFVRLGLSFMHAKGPASCTFLVLKMAGKPS